MWIFALIALTVAVTGGITLDSRYRKQRDRREKADDLEAARLRLAAAGEDPDAPGVFTSTTPVAQVYTSRHAVDTTPPTGRAAVRGEAFDQRTAVLIVDPTLSASDVATAIEHVEHGTGSIRSIAAASYDTREMRTAAEQKHLNEVYDAADQEDTERTFNGLVAGLWGNVDNAWPLIDAWVAKYHGEEHYATCVHCAEALHEHSDEYAQIVADRANTDTGEISKADIDALYALHGATT